MILQNIDRKQKNESIIVLGASFCDLTGFLSYHICHIANDLKTRNLYVSSIIVCKYR